MFNIQDLCQHHQVHETVHPVMNGLQGSMILKIAGQVRQLQAQGKEVCNLTVGDFDPKHFPSQTYSAPWCRKPIKMVKPIIRLRMECWN